MRQVLHLMVVDGQQRLVLAGWHGGRWWLPIVSSPERARAGPLACRWANEHGIVAETVGQWLGRVDVRADATDWLVVLAMSARAVAPPAMSWAMADALRSSSALLDYQELAVRKAMGRTFGPSVPGAFGGLSWLEDVVQWIERVGGAPCRRPVVTYRAAPCEVVLGTAINGVEIYFKGLTKDRAPEASLTSRLWQLMPDSFARTLALDQRVDGTVWWLMAGCPGAPFGRFFTVTAAAGVASALAHAQRRLSDVRDGSLDLPQLPLAEAASWSQNLLRACAEQPGHVDACCRAIDRACTAVAAPSGEHRWLPMDLDPENVLLDRTGRVRFIDLDQSYLGPAPVALASLTCRIARSGAEHAADLINALRRAYLEAGVSRWVDEARWRQLDVVAAVVSAYVGWQRLLVHARRGEVDGAVDLARTRLAARLIRVAATVGGGPLYSGR